MPASEPTLVEFQAHHAMMSDGSRIEFPVGTVPLFKPDVFGFPGPEGLILRYGQNVARLRMNASASAVQAAADELAG